jgi:hypothetical protein
VVGVEVAASECFSFRLLLGSQIQYRFLNHANQHVVADNSKHDVPFLSLHHLVHPYLDWNWD